MTKPTTKTMFQTEWDLGDLYASQEDAKLETDWQAADKLIDELKTFRGKINELNSDTALKLLESWENLAFLFHKLGLYAGLLESTHVNVPEVTRFVKKMEERMVAKGQEILFIDVEFAHLPDTKWQELLDSPKLKKYGHFLGQMREEAKHTLSESEEKILAEKSQTSSMALNHLYDVTTDTLQFAWDNDTITLEQLMAKFYDPDPAVRKQTAIVLHKGLETNTKTTPAIYNALVQDKTINDRLRHFEYPEAARFLSDEVDKDTVEAMVQAVSGRYDLVKRYYDIKKKLLKTDTLYWWDRYAPLPEMKTKIPLEQAREMVLESFHQFAPELGEGVNQMYKQHHIDWLPRPHKQNGAFCAMSGRSISPYVLLNYTESPRDSMVLAHELGHALHDLQAQSKNVFFETHPSLALAEIASTFGEFLLFQKLTSDESIAKQDRIALIMVFIEDSFSTIYRQTTMFQFEQLIHAKRRSEGELSKEQIDEMWHETMSKPFASSLIYTDEHKNTWMYVSHVFRTPFYVYSYSFAKLCSLALMKQYLDKGADFVPRYLKILQAGGSLSPKDNLKQAGLDVAKPEFWQSGLDVIETYMNQLSELANKEE